MTFRFGSTCSGIEAASVAWNPLGWKAAWVSDIEPFPNAVLAHHYPGVPNLGDMLTIAERVRSGEVEAPDLLCGGTPCQSFSVSGLRLSLADERGQLTPAFCDLADAIDEARAARGEPPAIVFWENVEGVLSTRDNAFGCLLGALAGEDCALQPAGGEWTHAGCVLGPRRNLAWRVLDAQFFGLAQQRRRVFVVASARKDFDCGSVLLERARPDWNGQAARAEATHPCLQTTFNDYSRADGFLAIQHGDRWRRVTMEEAETLQGFPRGYTAVPYNGRPADKAPEKARAAAIGNSWPVPVVRWIGRRIFAELYKQDGL